MNSSYLESIKVVDGKVYNLSYHQQRYKSVLNSLGVKDIKELKNYIKPPSHGTYKCRIVYDIHTISTSYHPYKKRDIKSLKLIHNDKIIYDKKYLNREKLDELFLQKGSADDILIVKNSLVTDTSIANIAFFDGESWLTPSTPLLKGTTRARLLNEKKIVTKDIYVDDLYRYKKIALLNAMIDFDIIRVNNLRDFYC